MLLILLTIIGLIVGLAVGYLFSKNQHEKSIDGANNTASGIVEQAKKEADQLQKTLNSLSYFDLNIDFEVKEKTK